jgi:hypothetical protein
LRDYPRSARYEQSNKKILVFLHCNSSILKLATVYPIFCYFLSPIAWAHYIRSRRTRTYLPYGPKYPCCYSSHSLTYGSHKSASPSTFGHPPPHSGRSTKRFSALEQYDGKDEDAGVSSNETLGEPVYEDSVVMVDDASTCSVDDTSPATNGMSSPS